MALHKPDQLYQWLDRDGIVRSCEFQRRDDPAYTIRVTTAETTLRVTKDDGNAPVRVVGRAAVDPGLLVAFGQDTHRQNFLTQLSAIVTGTDGRVAFVDGNGDRCELREMRGVRVENRVYPGAVTRHRLLRSVGDVSATVGYLDVVLRNFHSFDPPRRSP